MFWPCSAGVTSVAVRPSDCSWSGSSQIRMRIIAAAEHGDRADAVDARQRVLDLRVSRSWR